MGFVCFFFLSLFHLNESYHEVNTYSRFKPLISYITPQAFTLTLCYVKVFSLFCRTFVLGLHIVRDDCQFLPLRRGEGLFRHQVMAPGTGGIGRAWSQAWKARDQGCCSSCPVLIACLPRSHSKPVQRSHVWLLKRLRGPFSNSTGEIRPVHLGHVSKPLLISYGVESRCTSVAAGAEKGVLVGSPPETFVIFTLISRWCASNCEKYLSSSLLSFSLKYPDIFHLSSLSLAHNHLALDAENIKGCPRKYLLGHRGIEHLFPVLVEIKQQA